jgi:hypothetical protein
MRKEFLIFDKNFRPNSHLSGTTFDAEPDFFKISFLKNGVFRQLLLLVYIRRTCRTFYQ